MTDELPISNLAERIVDVWCSEVDDRSIDLDALESILSPEEQDRAGRFRFDLDARRFKVRRALLRVGLALHLQQPVGTIQIRTGENRKPFVEGGGIHFSVSHSKGTVLIAFSTVGEVGVDVEAIDHDEHDVEIASAYFTRSEGEFVVAAGGEAARADRFAWLWTRKEAVLKATGAGIAGGLNSFDVSGGEIAKVKCEEGRGETGERTLLVRDIEVDGKMKAAVAGPPSAWMLKVWTVRPRLLFDGVRARFSHLLR